VHENELYSRISDVEKLTDDTYVIATISGIDQFDQHGRIEWIKNRKVIRSIDLPYYCDDIQLNSTSKGLMVDIDDIDECDVYSPRFFSVLLDTFSYS